MSEDKFDPCIFPLGPISKMTSSIPKMELLLEPTGFHVRESLDPTLKYQYPIAEMSVQEQWPLLYEELLKFDVSQSNQLEAMCTLVHEPLLMGHFLLQRAPDPELETRGCLRTKYPW